MARFAHRGSSRSGAPRPFAGVSFVVVAALVLGALSAPPRAPAAEAPPAPPAPPAPRGGRDILREKTVYVPYEKLQEIFEKEGRGIFLPYEEFLRLWEAARPKPPEPAPDAPPADAVVRGGTYAGTVSGDVARFTVTYDIEALKKGWSEVVLPLKGVALEKVQLSSPDALFRAKGEEYSVLLRQPGSCELRAEFSARVQQEPGKKTVAFQMPPTAVSRLELTIPEADVRVDVRPMLAVTQTTTAENATKVLAFLGNSSDLSVSWMPPVGKAEDGALVFAKQYISVNLGERILRIATDIEYRITRGEVDSLQVKVPEGMRLLSVKGDNIREFPQEGDVVTVKLHSALKDSRQGGDGVSYRLSLGFERILEDTPSALPVPFPSVPGVIYETGWVVFGHESGLNVRVRSTRNLSQLDKDEVPEPLRPGLGIGFQYLAQPVELQLDVEKIVPSISSTATSVVSIGKEEDVWVGWIDYDIAKAGVFRLELRFPARWTVATLGDAATVEDFTTEESPDGTKTVKASLRSKALGAFRLPFRLTAGGSASQAEATLVPPVVVSSRQDRGLFGAAAPKAFSLTTVEREKMTSADVDELFRSGILNQLGPEAGVPLTYSYREPGASLKVRLEAKKTEIDVLAQHLVEISDGGIKLTHILDFEILYAAVDRLTFTAPAALDAVLKVEASAKKELRKVSTTGDRTLWELVLQAPALGAVSVSVNHETELKALEPGKPLAYQVPIVHAAEARERNGFVAVRKEGTLEIVPQATGMEAIDAGDLPDKLRRGQIYGAYRYFSADPSLALTLTRYEYQALATTIVNLLRMKSVLSEDRRLKTEAILFVQNTERQYLEIQLAPAAQILSISVAGRAQQPRQRKAGSGTLIQIPASAGAGGTFPVVLVYEEPLSEGRMGSVGSVALRTPEVLEGVPVTKIELDLYLSPDYRYLGWRGTLHPRFAYAPGLWSRFKGLVNRAFQADNAATPVTAGQAQAAGPAPTPGAIEVDIPTRGYVLHGFESLSPVGTLRFSYAGGTLWSLLDFLAFVVAAAAGWLLVTKARRKKSSVALLVIFLPLALVWFSRGAIVEVFTSLLLGGVVLFVALLAGGFVRRVRAYRASRLAVAPDPFLEDAASAPKSEGPTAPPAGESPPPASPGPGAGPTPGAAQGSGPDGERS